MKKSTKTALKVGIGASVALFAACEGIYEGVLSRLSMDLNKKYQLFTDGDTAGRYEDNPERLAGVEWFEAIRPKAVSVKNTEGKSIYAFLVKQDIPTDKWAICVHGYTDEPLGVANIGKFYYDNGYNVLFPCLKAHSLDTEMYCSMGYYDRYMICRWIDYITAENAEAQIVLHGVSMGSATTMLVTGEDIPENVKCAICDCGYTSVWDEYKSQIGVVLHLPVFPFLYILNGISIMRKNFDFRKCAPIEAVKKSNTPTLFIHGEKDKFVPYEMMYPLYCACKAEREMLSVPDAYHAVSSYIHPEIYWPKVSEFVGKHMNAEPKKKPEARKKAVKK
ncbi:MAG: alpha/beta hydrolase [Clostridia bacterium]|nr:alpha/beta hydrolase [Clostridia bacterium]